MVHKDDIKKRFRKGGTFEKRLWHGTSPDTFNHINTHGFNRSYCGKNGERILPQRILSLFSSSINHNMSANVFCQLICMKIKSAFYQQISVCR